MKPYVHNPVVFRKHFAGQGLPAFKGTRIQHGYGSWITKLKRFAVPLLMAGATAAAPHISKVAQKVAQSAAQRIFPNNPAMQRVVGNIAGKVTKRAVKKVAGTIKKRKRARGVTHPAKRRATTFPNIFA